MISKEKMDYVCHIFVQFEREGFHRFGRTKQPHRGCDDGRAVHRHHPELLHHHQRRHRDGSVGGAASQVSAVTTTGAKKYLHRSNY